MRFHWRAVRLVFELAFLMSLCWTAQGWSQIICIYPPPQGNGEAFARLQEKMAGMRLQTGASHSIQHREGVWRALVLLIDFPDYRWHNTGDENFLNPDSIYKPQHFASMLFSVGAYADPFSASTYTGSLRDFYRANSYGRFDIDGDVAGWFTARQGLAYYVGGSSGLGGYPNNAQRLVEEAVAQADAVVDFSQYDNDGDGAVDALFIVHAGPGAEYIAGSNPVAAQRYLWSHFGGINSMRADNVQVGAYAFMPEDGAIGVFCHEFGHGLGLPDLYDPDGSSEGVGEWCLMGSGSWCFKSGDALGTSPSYFSAWSRLRLGWATPLAFQDGETIRLLPIENSDNILLLRNAAIPAGEYFLLENRQPIGFDAGLTRRQKDFALPAPSGLMIYHIDGAGSPSIDQRRLVDVEEASPYFNGLQSFEQLDGRRDPPSHAYLNRGNRGDNGDPFPGFANWTGDLSDFIGPRQRDRFDDFSVPSSRANGGALTGIAVHDIRLDSVDVLCRVFTQGVTEVADENSVVPRRMRLYALPNPAHGSFRLTGQLPAGRADAAARFFDVLGREVASREIHSAIDGRFEWTWNSLPQLPAGIYFAVVQSGELRATAKVLLLR